MWVAKKSFGQYKCSSRPMIMAISPTVLRPITASFYFAAANFADNCWRQKRTRLGLYGKRAAVDWERCANVQMCKCGETNLPPRLGTCFEEIIQIQRNFLVHLYCGNGYNLGQIIIFQTHGFWISELNDLNDLVTFKLIASLITLSSRICERACLCNTCKVWLHYHLNSFHLG